MATKDIHELVKLVKRLAKEQNDTPTKPDLLAAGASFHSIDKAGGFLKILEAAGMKSRKNRKAERNYKILVLDIELFPLKVLTWDIWQTNIAIDFIIEDWSVACWTAKWYGDDKHVYRSVEKHCPKNIRNDKEILQEMRDLLDQADVVLTQNGKKFDVKKLTYRFIKHKIKPPSRFRQLDTKEISKRIAALSSNSLAFMSREINEKWKKLKHNKFPGNAIFLETMDGNKEAWKEMEIYNLYDVLATEEYYSLIAPYDTSINWNVYSHDLVNQCFCGSIDFYRHPHKKKTTRAGRYSLFICNKCGRDWYHGENELTKEKREIMLR